jgi:hypothetical protein
VSKKSKRPGRAARDIHATIRADAEALKASPHPRTRDGEDFPELNALLCAYRNAIAAAVPRSIIFEGRAYYGRARLVMHLDVFAGPGESEPLVSAVNLSSEGYGHAPGH